MTFDMPHPQLVRLGRVRELPLRLRAFDKPCISGHVSRSQAYTFHVGKAYGVVSKSLEARSPHDGEPTTTFSLSSFPIDVTTCV